MKKKRKLPAGALELRATLRDIRMTQVGFASLIGLFDRTVRRYVLGEAPIPTPVHIIANLMRDGVVSEDQVKEARDDKS